MSSCFMATTELEVFVYIGGGQGGGGCVVYQEWVELAGCSGSPTCKILRTYA